VHLDNEFRKEIQYGANYISYIDIFFICEEVVIDKSKESQSPDREGNKGKDNGSKEFQIRDEKGNKVFDDASTLKMLFLHEHEKQIFLFVETAPKCRPQYYSSEPHEGMYLRIKYSLAYNDDANSSNRVLLLVSVYAMSKDDDDIGSVGVKEDLSNVGFEYLVEGNEYDGDIYSMNDDYIPLDEKWFEFVNEDEDEWIDNINSNFIMAKTLNDA